MTEDARRKNRFAAANSSTRDRPPRQAAGASRQRFSTRWIRHRHAKPSQETPECQCAVRVRSGRPLPQLHTRRAGTRCEPAGREPYARAHGGPYRRAPVRTRARRHRVDGKRQDSVSRDFGRLRWHRKRNTRNRASRDGCRAGHAVRIDRLRNALANAAHEPREAGFPSHRFAVSTYMRT